MEHTIVDLVTARGVTTGTRLLLGPSRKAASRGRTGAVENGDHQFFVEGGDIATIEPEELFQADAELGPESHIRRGRFRPGNFVGTVEVRAQRADGEVLTGLVEVSSTKLDFEHQYRWMLAGVAEHGAELLLRTFSPAQLTLRADHSRTPQARYQQLAFLSAILRRPHTVEAVERILRQPYVSYRDDPVERPIGRGVAGGSRTVRALTAPGPRQPARPGLASTTLPVVVRDLRPEATIDNVPNQYVRFVCDHWIAVLDEAATALTDDTPAGRRGRREVDDLRGIVDGWRHDPRFADVGRLRSAPAGNQAVHRRPGYRELHQAFVESQAAAMLTWEGGEDLHRAGQQDIAQLYEYWCYLELRRIVERHCVHTDATELVRVSDDGMHLVLSRGRQRAMRGHLVHAGRLIDLELWFNRSFGGTESWTLQMRPDCSISFSAQTTGGERVTTWVHFDAKYKVNAAAELFVDDDDLERMAEDEGAADPRGPNVTGRAVRADLLKMHAYHDAIRSSAGSYVLFPGDTTVRKTKHREILPGLGAVPFVPSSDGHATTTSARAVEDLFGEILDHIAHQASSRERSAWWETEANRSLSEPGPVFVPLGRPPADVTVLVGYTRSAAHRRWVEESGRYNLRFGGRRGSVDRTGSEAAAETLLLWCPDDAEVHAWTLTDHLGEIDADGLAALGYPSEPQGRYLLRTLDRRFDIPEAVNRAVIERLTARVPSRAPFATTWAAVLATMDRATLGT